MVSKMGLVLLMAGEFALPWLEGRQAAPIIPGFPVRPVPGRPHSKSNRWIRNPINNFILAGLETDNLHPSAEAIDGC